MLGGRWVILVKRWVVLVMSEEISKGVVVESKVRDGDEVWGWFRSRLGVMWNKSEVYGDVHNNLDGLTQVDKEHRKGGVVRSNRAQLFEPLDTQHYIYAA